MPSIILLVNCLFVQGLADELSKEGACEEAIFPDTSVVVDSCAMIGNLSVQGVSNKSSASYLFIYLYVNKLIRVGIMRMRLINGRVIDANLI